MSPFHRVMATLLLIALIPIPASFGQTSEGVEEERRYDRAWLELEAAARDVREGDYSAALRRYARALELRPRYPEAFVGMARIYRMQSDILLAERYYREAIASSGQLEIPDEIYAIRMELATMYDETRINSDGDRKYQNQLLTIIEDDPTFSLNEPPEQREMMVRTLLESGLNRVIVLYRLDFPQALEAHRRYATYLLQEGPPSRRTDAVDHLLFATVEVAGRAVNAIIRREYDFEFTTLHNLYETARRYPAVVAYLRNEEFIILLEQLRYALTLHPRGQRAVRELEGELRQITSRLND